MDVWFMLDFGNLRWWIELSEVCRNLGLLAGGAFGLYLAWKRVTAANRQSEAALKQAETAIMQSQLSRRIHVAELFNQAAGQLGDEKLEIRLGAVYTLRDIAKDFPALTASVFDLLNLYLRERVTKIDSKIDADKLLFTRYEKRIIAEEIMKVLAISTGVRP
jgi:hypothetical protein